MGTPASSLLVFNAGSSSLKFAAFRSPGQDDALLLKGEVTGIGSPAAAAAWRRPGSPGSALALPDNAAASHESCFEFLLPLLLGQAELGAIAGIGHRILHGGPLHDQPTLIDAALLATLESLIPLAPLHQGHGLHGVRFIARRFPALPQVACFDTGFHRTQPALARTYALPLALREQGIRRYGFHGLSCEHAVRALRRESPTRAAGRLILAHLGSGSSLTAIAQGHSVASTMGFSPIDGPPMGTRCGTLDPGVLLYLLRQGMSAATLEDLLYHRSGLLALSGRSSDLRELLEASGDPEADFAVASYVYHVVREIGSLVAALGGLDSLVFTGGIGEHSENIRARICAGLDWLGVRLDPALNATAAPAIDAQDSRVGIRIIPADEEAVIASATETLLAACSGHAVTPAG